MERSKKRPIENVRKRERVNGKMWQSSKSKR